MKTLQKIVLLLSGLSFVLSGVLVYHHITHPPFCPYLFRIPACYLVLFLYGTLIAVTLRPISVATNVIYLTTSAAGIAIGLWFSWQQIYNIGSCPTLFEIPVPLCFASLFAFLTLTGLRVFELKSRTA